VTVAQPAIVPGRHKELPHPTPPALFGAAARAEWTKLRSVRSTVWSLLVTVVITIGLGALIDLARISRWDHLSPDELRTFDPTGFSLSGIFLAQLAVGVLGVIVISSEYSTGQIRATIGAVPQRRMVLAAKAAVFTAVVLVIGLVTCFVAFFIGQAMFASKHAQATLSDPGVLRAVIGGALYLAAIGLLAVGLGTILRRTAGGIATLVGILLVLPILAGFLPSPWNDDVSKLLPGQGTSIFQITARTSGNLPAWAGLGVLCAWAAVSLVVGAVLLSRRDA
jgi:ABC-2 type transport system permease protein